jgi:5'-nucleotidase
MARVKTMSDFFDLSEQENTDKLKFASGDIMLGADDKYNVCANMFMNATGISSSALGNHEFDSSPDELARLTQNAKFKVLGINLHVAKDNPLYNRIEKSYIEEKNGHKYGIIGLAPPDLHERIRANKSREQIAVDDFEKTIQDIKAEVEKFKSQDINKIIVLSHSGLAKDRRIAEEIEGIDIIMSAHTHELIKDIKEGENLLYSQSGEPVIITQAGKDGEQAGVLNVEFNSDGVITKAQNNVMETKDFRRNIPLRAAFEQILGPAEKLGVIKSAPPAPADRLVDPNPHAYFIADAMRKELGTDMALVNAGNVRGYFEAGTIDSRQVFEVVPLKNNAVTLKLTEKEITDALKSGAKSFLNPGHKPSVIMPSGLKYTVSKQGEIKELYFIDKQGKEVPIDVNNPNPNKTYTVAADDFFASGGDGLIPDKMTAGQYDKLFDYDKDKITCDYIKKFTEPIEIKDDGRITVAG